jgi:hypothetical protein
MLLKNPNHKWRKFRPSSNFRMESFLRKFLDNRPIKQKYDSMNKKPNQFDPLVLSITIIVNKYIFIISLSDRIHQNGNDIYKTLCDDTSK